MRFPKGEVCFILQKKGSLFSGRHIVCSGGFFDGARHRHWVDGTFLGGARISTHDAAALQTQLRLAVQVLSSDLTCSVLSFRLSHLLLLLCVRINELGSGLALGVLLLAKPSARVPDQEALTVTTYLGHFAALTKRLIQLLLHLLPACVGEPLCI